MIEFVIKGNPKTQKRHRMGRGFSYDPSKKDKQDIVAIVQQNAPKKPLLEEIELEVYFYMPYPKKWLRTGKYEGQLKENAPIYCQTKPDLDNMVKLVMDALSNNVIYEDDKQIVVLTTVKCYSKSPRTEIIIRESNEFSIPRKLQEE